LVGDKICYYGNGQREHWIGDIIQENGEKN
jgi:hypothetical protein